MGNGYQVYILQSRSNNRYYCGYTANLDHRLKSHNDPEYRLTRTTKAIPGPWEVVWTSDQLTRSEAMKLEKRVKKRGIERFLSDV